MKNLEALLERVKEKPKAIPKIVQRLFGELGDGMKGVVEFDVPAKFAKLFEMFANDKTDEKDLDGIKDLLPKKGITLKALAKEIKGAKEKKKVKLDLSKVKKVIGGNIDKAVEEPVGDGEMNESFSLLQEDAALVGAVATVASGGIIILASIASVVYTIWIIVRCVENNTVSFFDDDSNVAGVVVSLVFLLGGAALLWAILMHIKLNKLEGKGSKKNESAEGSEDGDDSVLSGMPMIEFATGEEALDAVDGNDQELLNAYRMVLSDLKHRSPNGAVPDPLKEGAEGNPEGEGESEKLQENSDPEDDSIFSTMESASDKK